MALQILCARRFSGLLLRNSVHSASTTRCTQGHQTLFLAVIEGVACETIFAPESLQLTFLSEQYSSLLI